jgi:hypothetical protein
MGLSDGGGRTIELEFETSNVTDNSAVICDMRNDKGLGMLITASQASLFVSPTSKVSCNYKANELLRIGFVLDYTRPKDIALIYINGVVSGATSLASLLNINNELTFNGTDGASIKINNIRVYNIPLSSEQMLNNYIMTRSSISDMMTLYNRNNIMNGGVIDIDLVSNFIPVITLTGNIFELEQNSSTDLKYSVDVEYINKQDPNHQFRFYGGCCRIQGTSSASYIRKN